MSAMTSFTRRSLAKNRVRTTVTVAGVALAAALLTAVLSSVNSLNAYLYNSELADNGPWTASVWTDDANAVRAAAESEHVEQLAFLQDVGFCALTPKGAESLGRYLAVRSAEGDLESVCAVGVSEGRAPETASEIMLPSFMKDSTEFAESPCDIGSVITLDLGQRELVASDANEYPSPLAGSSIDDSTYLDGVQKDPEQAGDRLNSGDRYRDAISDGGAFDEQLVELQSRTYTVTGFYDTRNIATSTGVGYSGITAHDESARGAVKAYLVTSGLTTQKAIGDEVSSLLSGANVSYHATLLRYAGITDDRAIWDTYYGIAGVLAVVIVVSCVSLIYNAFAISVAERTRQFGLLASIGASRRQLRGAIVYEALLVALTGIPLGLLAGLGGTAAVLGALAPSIEDVLGGREGVAFGLSVDPASVAFSAALTLATVLISVWLPARRAGSVSAIDAIRRTNDVRPAKERKLRRRAFAGAGGKRESNPSKPDAVSEAWRPRGLGMHRLFGAVGHLVYANGKRGRSKGQAASVSLALAVVLLMTAGTLSTYLGVLSNAVTSDKTIGDISFFAYERGNESLSSEVDTFDRFEDIAQKLAQAQSAKEVGRQIFVGLPCVVPATVAGANLVATTDDSSAQMAKQPDGSYIGYVQAFFIDDEAFRAYATQVGANPDEYFGDTARGIGIGSTYGNNGKSYVCQEMFAHTGSISRIAAGSYDDKPLYSLGWREDFAGEGDKSTETLVTGLGTFNDPNVSGPAFEVPIDQVDLVTSPIEIAALTDQLPEGVTTSSPTIILPLSACERVYAANDTLDVRLRTYPTLYAYYEAENHIAATNELNELGEEICGENATGSSVGSGVTFFVNDKVADVERSQMLVTIVNVFTLLFTVILMLIAMANVFNTVTNGLVLRRREFAVMKSIGMGDRAFRRMIACECIGYGTRGIIPGIVISLVVSYLLFMAIQASIEGIAFTLPWAHLGVALALTCAAMVASVAYGMHRCKADSVVEALRMDAA